MKKVILVGLMFVVFFGWKDIVSADSVTEENVNRCVIYKI